QDVFFGQGSERYDVVDPVDEFRGEVPFEVLAVERLPVPVVGCRLAGRIVAYAFAALHNLPRSHVRGHDDDRIAEIDQASQSVGQSAFVENLQHQVEYVAVRFFDL